ncbi:ATP-binding cassette domain-containing protein [Paenibacillus chartarius]|uniref:ATP-binding cassette domain-containing protein n=1 Tax=Paenibacillus chartarius TaxID=747481 RepID=A0ABV6DPB4_9BACL
MSPILEITDLAKYHPSASESYIFTNINASITEPEIIAVLGGSGQGKSTLLRILSSLDRPDEGAVRFKGQTVDEWKPRLWRMNVCYVAQQAVMLPGTVEDNLKAPSKIHQQEFDRKLAEHLMNRVNLVGLDWAGNAEQLSGGEKQRLALIRSLLLRPQILLLDEVTSALDAYSKQCVEALLQDWRERYSTTIIWVTHELEQARRVSSRVWFMGANTLLEDRAADSFFQAPSTETARKFLYAFSAQGGS